MAATYVHDMVHGMLAIEKNYIYEIGYIEQNGWRQEVRKEGQILVPLALFLSNEEEVLTLTVQCGS